MTAHEFWVFVLPTTAWFVTLIVTLYFHNSYSRAALKSIIEQQELNRQLLINIFQNVLKCGSKDN